MKIFWAFEPTHQEPKRLKGMHHTLAMMGGNPDEIEVGMVVTHTEPWLSLAFDIPEDKRFTEYPRTLISQTLKKGSIKVKHIKLIDAPAYTTSKAVESLLEYTEDKKIGLIGLYTHGRSGFKRFLLGSFSETMIHKSKASLMLFNPRVKLPKKIKKILVCLDFSESWPKQLKKVLEYCQRVKADLHVFHHADPTFKWAFDEKDPEVVAYRQKTMQIKSKILKECGEAGVGCEVQVVCPLKSTSDLIVKAADRYEVQVIALFAKGGSALMGGSVTRQVVRKSELPVLVLR